ncbi:MAG: hypothetical protein ACRDRS_02085 [Pseudonocardiaceae bacterium]
MLATTYPDYALLFAWNHAEEIMVKERIPTRSMNGCARTRPCISAASSAPTR